MAGCSEHSDRTGCHECGTSHGLLDVVFMSNRRDMEILCVKCLWGILENVQERLKQVELARAKAKVKALEG